MKKAILAIIVLYLVVSCVFSVGHALSDNPWDFRMHRNGLLCVEFAENELVIYSLFAIGLTFFSLGLDKMKMDGILSLMDFIISVNGMFNKHPIFNFKINVKLSERSFYLIYV